MYAETITKQVDIKNTLKVYISPILPLDRETWRHLLSANEFQRVQNINHDERANACGMRALMRRLLLANTQNINLKQASIVQNRIGTHSSKDGNYYFSSSSSGAFVATICSPYPNVGLDIEIDRIITEPEILAQQYLNQEEYFHWVKAGKRKYDLLALWTKKEARLKADGVGLGGNIKQRSVDANTDSAELITSYLLPLSNPLWCAIYHNTPYHVEITLLGSQTLIDTFRGYIAGTQAIDKVISKVSHMRQNPSTVRLV